MRARVRAFYLGNTQPSVITMVPGEWDDFGGVVESSVWGPLQLVDEHNSYGAPACFPHHVPVWQGRYLQGKVRLCMILHSVAHLFLPLFLVCVRAISLYLSTRPSAAEPSLLGPAMNQARVADGVDTTRWMCILGLWGLGVQGSYSPARRGPWSRLLYAASW